MASSPHDRQTDAALLAASRSGHKREPRKKAPETYEEKLAQLNELRTAALHSAPEAEEKQHARGKYTARERVEKLLDPGSFQELDTFVRDRVRLMTVGRIEGLPRGVQRLLAATV